MIEELTLDNLLLILFFLVPLGILAWGLVIIALIKIFKGEW